jgi:hypothetical protein
VCVFGQHFKRLKNVFLKGDSLLKPILKTLFKAYYQKISISKKIQTEKYFKNKSKNNKT